MTKRHFIDYDGNSVNPVQLQKHNDLLTTLFSKQSNLSFKKRTQIDALTIVGLEKKRIMEMVR